jgi:hypothetical protein
MQFRRRDTLTWQQWVESGRGENGWEAALASFEPKRFGNRQFGAH